MYSTCIACIHRLGTNAIIEHLPVGCRIELASIADSLV
jgi:hypothetical protein